MMESGTLHLAAASPPSEVAVRMAELSRRSGLPVATIKYYRREGLLPPGTPTAPNQSDYGESHVQRLELIGALRDTAGLPIARIAEVLAIMERYRADPSPELLAMAVGRLAPRPSRAAADDEGHARAYRVADELLRWMGWDVEGSSPGRRELVEALVAVDRLLPGFVTGPGSLVPYATAVRRLAEVEIPDHYEPVRDPGAVLLRHVLETVFLEPVLLALRKLARADRQRLVAALGPDRGGQAASGLEGPDHTAEAPASSQGSSQAER